MKARTLARLCLSAVFTCVVAASSAAQTAGASGGGLFGSERVNPNSRSLMRLDWSVFEDYATDMLGAAPSDPDAAVGGPSSGADARLTMGRDGRRVSFGAVTSTTVRYYPELKDLASSTAQTAVDLRVRLSRQTHVRLGQVASYSPFFELQVAPVPSTGDLGSLLTDGAYAVSRNDTYQFGSSVELTHAISRRTTLSADYSVQRMLSTRYGLFAQRGGGRLSTRLNGSMSAHAGYGYRVGRAGPADAQPASATHDVDAGVTYGRTLSFSRRTTLAFNSGSSVVSFSGQHTLGLLGLASLTHQLGRSWTASVRYRRGLDYLNGFNRPVFSDSVSGHVEGRLNRRVDAAALLTTSTGTPAGATGSGLASWAGFARVRVALSRRLALYAQYGSHQYRWSPADADAAGPAGRIVRHSIRVGLTGRMPLIH